MHTLYRFLPHFVAVILVAALSAVVYWQVRDLTLSPATTAQGKPQTVAANPAPETRQHNIAAFSLFGKVGAKPAERPVEEKVLPKTKLKLTLTGVSAGTGDRVASALIEGPDRNTELYKVGDTLPGNAKLHQIYAERIVIERSGRLENLYFPEVSTGGAQYLAAVSPEMDEDSAEIQPMQEPPGASSPSLSESRKQSIKDRLNAIRSRIRAGQN